LLDGVSVRRSAHKCNGGNCCEFFDTNLLDGYTRDDSSDMTLTQKIFAAELVQNEQDSVTIIAKTAA
jgi:hypothetical protein